MTADAQSLSSLTEYLSNDHIVITIDCIFKNILSMIKSQFDFKNYNLALAFQIVHFLKHTPLPKIETHIFLHFQTIIFF